MISFVPQVYVPWLASKEIPKEKNNLLAYADIANYDPELYLETMYKQEKVNLEEIKQKALELNCPFLLCSARTGSNVMDAFRYAAYKFLEQY